MADVNDVATAILSREGPMTAMKLQKLVYYCQAWHAVWEDRLLFDSPIEAWRNGPVCRELYNRHRGTFMLSEWPNGDESRLSPNEVESIEVVLQGYARYSAQQLSELTHSEEPWIRARRGCEPEDRGSAVITVASMAEFYEALLSESRDEAE